MPSAGGIGGGSGSERLTGRHEPEGMLERDAIVHVRLGGGITGCREADLSDAVAMSLVWPVTMVAVPLRSDWTGNAVSATGPSKAAACSSSPASTCTQARYPVTTWTQKADRTSRPSVNAWARWRFASGSAYRSRCSAPNGAEAP